MREERDGDRDWFDAEKLYDILENEIVPRYYLVDGDGVPHKWVRTMKAAMYGAGARFSARRMVKE